MARNVQILSVSGGVTTSTFLPDELKAMKEKMSSEANKDVREKYRSLLMHQQEKADGAGEAGIPIDELQQMVLEANEAFVKVQRPREATLDAEYLKMCGLMVKSNITNRQFNATEFHPTEFAQKMSRFMQGEEEAEANLLDSSIWKRLGSAVASIYINTPPLESTFAGIDYEKTKKEVRKKNAKKDEVGARVTPKLVKESLSEEERQTEELNRVYSILKRRYRENNKRPICFYTFVINPESYSYTIENIFHTSFLVHMLRAQIIEDENGLPVIIPRDSSASKGSEFPSSQCIVSLSTEEFKEAVKMYKLTDACIPPPQINRKRKENV